MAAVDDIGTSEIEETMDTLTTELQAEEGPETTNPGDDKHGSHIVGGEDMVILDDASETGKDDPLDDDHHVSTTSDDGLAGIGGEGAELHPEFDDFEDDDQHFEVLETVDGDFSGDSHDLEQSRSVGDSPSEKKERGREKESGKREKVSSEKSGMVYTN